MKAFVVALILASPAPLFAQVAVDVPAMTAAMSLPLGARVGNLSSSSTYDDGGRRDPFMSLVVAKRVAGPSDGRPRAGLAGLQLADVLVKGVVRNGDVMLAILETPGKQSFVARVKDKLADAAVRSIDRDGVVFEQMGSGSGTPVRKPLRIAGEDVR